MYYEKLFKKIDTPDHLLRHWAKIIPSQIENGLSPQRFGKLEQWQAAINKLPELVVSGIELKDKVKLSTNTALSSTEKEAVSQQLKQLHPWRKGPFDFFDIHIDTEWRSDWKWDRIKDHLQPLEGRTILDVGCGNGYHCWRMAGIGAELVIGIDPTAVFVMQYQLMQKYIQSENVFVLPVGIDDVPQNLQAFDTVFSMGVLYHRKSPIDHLMQLRQCLKTEGELVLETLIIDGNTDTQQDTDSDTGEVLLPKDRYAQMNNVWFLPTIPLLVKWLERCKFKNIRVVDVNQTSLEEQRTTEWMTFNSLSDFLDPNDKNLTVEGYPAPKRVIVLAEK